VTGETVKGDEEELKQGGRGRRRRNGWGRKRGRERRNCKILKTSDSYNLNKLNY
jgi:hypothetical protein